LASIVCRVAFVLVLLTCRFGQARQEPVVEAEVTCTMDDHPQDKHPRTSPNLEEVSIMMSIRRVRNICLIGVWTGLVTSAAGDVIFDSLCITDEEEYQALGPNYCGGDDIFGEPIDAQVAIAFRLEGTYRITTLTGDFLTELGIIPDRICVSFYRKNDAADCQPFNDSIEYLEMTRDAITWSRFPDTRWNHFEGLRLTVALDPPVELPAGIWFVCMQPATPLDYGYLVMTDGGRCESDFICPAQFRDGGERNPCCDGMGIYGWEDWRFPGIPYPGVGAMRVAGFSIEGCAGAERVKASCKGTGNKHRVKVKVRRGAPGARLQAELDPHEGPVQTITLKDNGKGRTTFKKVSPGPHTAVVCANQVEVDCP